MWTAVYWARDLVTADTIQKLLYDAGVLVKMKSMGGNDSDSCFEIFVEASDVDKAHNLIIDRGF